MSTTGYAWQSPRTYPGPNGGDPLRRIHTGKNHDQNSNFAVQLRDAPMDLNAFYQNTYANPQLMGLEDWRPIKRMGLGELQDLHAEKFAVNETRKQLEIFRSDNRRQIIRQDTTADKVPVFTHNSDWFRNVQEKMAAQKGGEGRRLFNNQRTYGL